MELKYKDESSFLPKYLKFAFFGSVSSVFISGESFCFPDDGDLATWVSFRLELGLVFRRERRARLSV